MYIPSLAFVRLNLISLRLQAFLPNQEDQDQSSQSNLLTECEFDPNHQNLLTIKLPYASFPLMNRRGCFTILICLQLPNTQ